MIRSFRCRETERVFLGQPAQAFPPDLTEQQSYQILLCAHSQRSDVGLFFGFPASPLLSPKNQTQE